MDASCKSDTDNVKKLASLLASGQERFSSPRGRNSQQFVGTANHDLGHPSWNVEHWKSLGNFTGLGCWCKHWPPFTCILSSPKSEINMGGDPFHLRFQNVVAGDQEYRYLPCRVLSYYCSSRGRALLQLPQDNEWPVNEESFESFHDAKEERNWRSAFFSNLVTWNLGK